MPTRLALAVHAELARVAVPEKAAAMQAYMKSTMPYLGVSAPAARAAHKRVFADYPFASAAMWRKDALALFRGARFREERYAAIALTGDRRARGFQALDALPMYEELIVTGAWWDYVDELASHRLGLLLELHPAPMREAMLDWSRCDDLWKRRAAILCQLRFKERTDLALLYACIEPALAAKEFFLRKAIGWALRQYAWTDGREVVRYVKKNRARLSPLSKREALKNALKEGLVTEVP
jgi:3-methyladenine DNA glycosylase AlkD